MVEPAELMVVIDRAFDRLAATMLRWPDPHPDGERADEEYSRVTNPEKWWIVGARADAWLEAFETLGLARVEHDVGVEWSEAPGTVVTRADRAVPFVAHALPLVVARSRVGQLDEAGVTIGVGDPAVVHVWIPDCGCDACDSGSQNELDHLDEHLLGVVTGQFRRLRRGDHTITVISDRVRQMSGHPALVDAASVLANPVGWHDLSGPGWLGRDPATS